MTHIPAEVDRGRRESEADISRGNGKLLWQTRGSWGELLTRLMQQRFGIQVEHIDCFTHAAITSYRRGYNEATQRHIDNQFGVGSFQAVLDEVEKYRQETYTRYLEQQNSQADEAE